MLAGTIQSSLLLGEIPTRIAVLWSGPYTVGFSTILHVLGFPIFGRGITDALNLEKTMDKRFVIVIALIFLVLLVSNLVTRRIIGPKETDRGYPFFSGNDFRYANDMLSKLRDAQEPLSRYLRGRLSEETRVLLDNYDSSLPPSESLQMALANELNQVLKLDEFLYDERRFAGVVLSEKTRELIVQASKDDDLVRLNRLLLDDAYPRKTAGSEKPVVVQGKESEVPAPELTTPPQEETPQTSEKTILVQTPLYELKLTTEGARATNWKLSDYLKRGGEPEAEAEYVDLIPPAAKKCLTIEFYDPEIQDELETNPMWTSNDGEFLEIVEETQGSVQFNRVIDYPSSAGMGISKKMTFFPDSYTVDIDIAFHNRSLEEMKLGGYRLYWGAGLAKDAMISDMDVAGEGPIVLARTASGSKLVKHWKRTGFACFGRNYEFLTDRHPDYPEEAKDAPVFWVGFASKYFVAALIPGPEPWWSDTERAGKRYAVINPSESPVLSPREVWREWGSSTAVALVRPEFSIAPGGTVSHQFRVYVGPKKWDILRSIDGRDGTTESLGLGKMINFGMFSPLGKATLWLLKTFYRVVNNYGVALIFLTILIKILYFPLTQKSFKSMKKMQGLQPKIAALKEKHRDDPQRLQKETMKLYKQQGVNPMGGCLPMLFQLPVFWALFSTLRNAVELRGAVFIPGWVNDLSLSDTVATVGGFPINILPLLMTGTMLLQQLLFSPGGKEQSNKMMRFMPLIFAFIFYKMPSGLVLYWLCNNVLAIGHQYMIRRQEDTETEDQPKEKGKRNRSNRR